VTDLLDVRRALVELRSREVALFVRLGRCVPLVEEPRAKVILATHSRRHGEHWTALGRLLPADAPEGVAFAAVASAEATTTVARLTGVYDTLVPELAGSYEDLKAGLDPVSAAPICRAVQAILAELAVQQAEGQKLLMELRTKEELTAATSKQSECGESHR